MPDSLSRGGVSRFFLLWGMTGGGVAGLGVTPGFVCLTTGGVLLFILMSYKPHPPYLLYNTPPFIEESSRGKESKSHRVSLTDTVFAGV